MPPAKPPLAPLPPHPLREDEAEAIKEIVRHFYGEDAVIRNYGPDPKVLALHVETSRPDAAGKSIQSLITTAWACCYETSRAKG